MSFISVWNVVTKCVYFLKNKVIKLGTSQHTFHISFYKYFLMLFVNVLFKKNALFNIYLLFNCMYYSLLRIRGGGVFFLGNGVLKNEEEKKNY